MKHSQTYQNHYKNIVKPLDYVLGGSINEVIWNNDCLKLWNKYKKAIMFYRKQLLRTFGNESYVKSSLTQKQITVLNGMRFTRGMTVKTLKRGRMSSYEHINIIALDDTAKICLVHMFCAFNLLPLAIAKQQPKKKENKS